MQQVKCLFFLLVTLISFTACAGELFYINEEYGFKITFSSDIWEEHKVFVKFIDYGNNIKIPGFYIALPTEDPDWYSSLEQGYASIFALSAFTELQWEQVKASEGEMFMEVEIGRNNKYIFSSSHAHASPKDLMDIFFNSDYTVEIFDTE